MDVDAFLEEHPQILEAFKRMIERQFALLQRFYAGLPAEEDAAE